MHNQYGSLISHGGASLSNSQWPYGMAPSCSTTGRILHADLCKAVLSEYLHTHADPFKFEPVECHYQHFTVLVSISIIQHLFYNHLSVKPNWLCRFDKSHTDFCLFGKIMMMTYLIHWKSILIMHLMVFLNIDRLSFEFSNCFNWLGNANKLRLIIITFWHICNAGSMFH